MGDLRNVLNGLKSSTTDSVPQNVEESWYDDKDSNEEQFQTGKAVACIWQEDVGYNITWYLGIVDQIVGDKVYVSYMRRSDKNKVWADYFQKKLKSMTQVEIKSLLEILRLGIQWWPWSEAILRDRHWHRLNSVLTKFQHGCSRYWFQGLCILTCFSPVLQCYTPWKHQKT